MLLSLFLLNLQHSNCNDSDREIRGKNFLTSAQRTQIVWNIILRIGTQNKRGESVMTLDQLLEAEIITAAYPVHDGNIKRDEGESPNSTNDRRVCKYNYFNACMLQFYSYIKV